MQTKERKELYQKAIKSWGVTNQVFMVMEESGEMLNALAKYYRNRSTPQEIITELADVWILMEQMAEVFGWDDFQNEVQYKLERLKKRLDNNEILIIEKGKTKN
jgi:NTP pyrophosphatase (non-canonical NTP hydrolase)